MDFFKKNRKAYPSSKGKKQPWKDLDDGRGGDTDETSTRKRETSGRGRLVAADAESYETPSMALREPPSLGRSRLTVEDPEFHESPSAEVQPPETRLRRTSLQNERVQAPIQQSRGSRRTSMTAGNETYDLRRRGKESGKKSRDEEDSGAEDSQWSEWEWDSKRQRDWRSRLRNGTWEYEFRQPSRPSQSANASVRGQRPLNNSSARQASPATKRYGNRQINDEDEEDEDDEEESDDDYVETKSSSDMQRMQPLRSQYGYPMTTSSGTNMPRQQMQTPQVQYSYAPTMPISAPKQLSGQNPYPYAPISLSRAPMQESSRDQFPYPTSLPTSMPRRDENVSSSSYGRSPTQVPSQSQFAYPSALSSSIPRFDQERSVSSYPRAPMQEVSRSQVPYPSSVPYTDRVPPATNLPNVGRLSIHQASPPAASSMDPRRSVDSISSDTVSRDSDQEAPLRSGKDDRSSRRNRESETGSRRERGSTSSRVDSERQVERQSSDTRDRSKKGSKKYRR